MNGTGPTARRRPPAPPPAPAFGGFNDRAYGSNATSCPYSAVRATVDRYESTDDGGQKKTRRKKSFLHRISNRSRWVDVLLLLGGVAKFVSMYHRRSATYLQHQRVASTLGTLHKHIQSITSTTPNQNYSWIDTWREKKMPFNTPALYRINEHGPSNKYIGMFRSKHLSSAKKSVLDERGYAIVDDLIFHSDDNRGHTDWALRDSECRPQSHQENEVDMSFSVPSIGFSDDEHSHEQQLYIDDGGDWDAYYAFDDDYIRSAEGTGLHEKLSEEVVKNQQCMRPSWYSIYHPTCNEIHSSVSGDQWMLGDDSLARNWESPSNHIDVPLSKYLGSGYYRDAFLLQRPFVHTNHKSSKLYTNVEASIEFDQVVFKSMKQLQDRSQTGTILGTSEDDEVMTEGWAYDPTDKYSYTELIEDMRKDAMVMELLTTSPRSANIYSYCALSSVIEFAPVDIEEYIMPSKGRHPKLIRRHADPEDHGLMEHPVNDHISPHEKLEIALEMAKCIAEMHGFADGPIAHVDVQAGQFFRGRDGLIKLVDYNRAEVLLYDIKADKYCKFVNGPPAEGMFRAPEENIDAPLTEKIDIFSLGNVFYSVLTGIMVHVGSDEAHRRIVEGINEPIADFYYDDPITAALAEAIELCWTYDAEERPTIFEIVQFLQKAVNADQSPHSELRKHR
ncbi:hypothetical protein ACHAXN_003692 [Cyclotella atomus]